MTHPWEKTWLLGDRIGKGGQGLTYHATNKDSNENGALKKLNNNRSPVARARMHREAANLQVLNTTDANVPRLLDHNTELHSDGKTELYIVSEFVPGPTLEYRVKATGLLDVENATALIQQIARTLSIAHTEQILHRDLKPDNIILRDGNTSDAVLIDFGLSFNESDDDLTENEETFRNKFLDLPETNTPGGDRRDARSDITCLSALLYFCLTGNRIGQLSDSDGVLPHRRSGFSLRDHFPDDARLLGLEALLDTGLQPSVTARHQTIDEFIARLELATDSAPEQAGNIADLAQLAYQQIHSTNRETQLDAILKQIQAAMNAGFKKTDALSKEIAPLGLKKQVVWLQKIPDGFDKLDQNFRCWTLTAPPNTELRIICVAIVADGDECVLVQQFAADQNDLPNLMSKSSGWTEIARFLPTNPDVEEIVFDSTQRILRSLLVEYATSS